MAVTPREILDDHVIYGDWGDLSVTEVLVYYHPNGKSSYVFIMGGNDDGGGIVLHGDLKSAVVEDLALLAKDKYEFHRMLSTLLKAKKKEIESGIS